MICGMIRLERYSFEFRASNFLAGGATLRLALLIILVLATALPVFAVEPVAVWTPGKADCIQLINTVEDGQLLLMIRNR